MSRRNRRCSNPQGDVAVQGKLLLQEIRGRPIDIVPAKKVVSINPGEWTSPFAGKGFEPMGYRDFVMGDNPRLIHMPTSARRGVPTIVERVALRDFKLMVVVDISPSMRIRSKQRILHEAAAVMLYAAWQAETTFGLAVRTKDGVQSFGLGIGSRHFYHAFRMLWRLLDESQDRPPKGSVFHLRRCLPPNAMLIYCSDFLDADGGTSELGELLRATTRYDFVPVIVQDAVEYSFPQARHGSLISFDSPETRVRDDIWVSGSSAKKIAALHESRFAELVGKFTKKNLAYVHLDAPGVHGIVRSINAFFRRRRRALS